MLFNEEVLFIHVPKMAGMSITTYLINDLPGVITIALPEMAFDHARRSARFADVRDRLWLIRGSRHEDLARAERVLSRHGRRLEDFRLILASMRNPYDLEVSYYCHLRKESVRKRRKRAVSELALARAGDFEAFARTAPYFGHLPSGIERYYTLRGKTPDNLQILRLEEIGRDIPILAPYTLGRFPVPHIN